MKRDLAVVVAKEILESQVRDVIMRCGGPLVETVEIFDVYEGEHVPQGSKSLAYAIALRDRSRTLTETDADDLLRRIEEGLREEVGGKIRTK